VHERGCDLTGDDRSGFAAAVVAAAAADVAVVLLGGRSGLDRESTVGEARDATDLRSPACRRSWPWPWPPPARPPSWS